MSAANIRLEDLADIKEAADRLAVSTKTIRRYISAGKITAHKIRNIWFVPLAEIEKLVEAKVEEESAISPMFDEFAESLRHIGHRLDQLEGNVSRMVKPQSKEADPQTEAKIAQFEEENRALRDEIIDLKEELASGRTEAYNIDPHMIKSRAEEIESLKATIVSNERGLALLREEVHDKNNIIKEKEEEILQLLEKLREMEILRKPQAFQETRKQGLLGNIMKGKPPTTGGRF